MKWICCIILLYYVYCEYFSEFYVLILYNCNNIFKFRFYFRFIGMYLLRKFFYVLY